MAAFWGLVVVNQFGIGFLGPALRGGVDLIGERADGDGDFDASDIEEASAGGDLRGVPVEACGRDAGVGEPVERDVVENVVAAQPLGLSVEDRVIIL